MLGLLVDETAEVDKICHSQRLGNPSQAPGPPAVTHYGDAQIRMTSPEHRRGSQDMFDPLVGHEAADHQDVRDLRPLDIEAGCLLDAVVDHPDAVGIDAEITTFDSSTIKDEFKTGEQQLVVRSYFWPNADIVDWFFSAERLGYPNVSMFNDPKAEELRVKAMTGSATQEQRVANFTVYHEYVTRRFPYAPIYQPVQNMAYNIDRIEMPTEIHATQITGVVMVDVKVKE